MVFIPKPGYFGFWGSLIRGIFELFGCFEVFGASVGLAPQHNQVCSPGRVGQRPCRAKRGVAGAFTLALRGPVAYVGPVLYGRHGRVAYRQHLPTIFGKIGRRPIFPQRQSSNTVYLCKLPQILRICGEVGPISLLAQLALKEVRACAGTWNF